MTVTVEALAAELAASDQFAVRTVLPGDGSLAQDVLDVTHDSRSVSTGWLFCCVPGAGFDGHDFAEAASRAARLRCWWNVGSREPQRFVLRPRSWSIPFVLRWARVRPSSTITRPEISR